MIAQVDDAYSVQVRLQEQQVEAVEKCQYTAFSFHQRSRTCTLVRLLPLLSSLGLAGRAGGAASEDPVTGIGSWTELAAVGGGTGGGSNVVLEGPAIDT